MIAPLDQIKDLLRGDTAELVIEQEPPKVGTVQPLRPGGGRSAKCRVLIVEVSSHEQGYSVRVEIVPAAHTPRLLAKQGRRHPPQYTTSSLSALSHEPEAVPADYQDRITEEARMLGHQENIRRQMAWEQRDFLERLEDEILEAERLGLNPGRDMARLEAGLAKMQRRNALARQQNPGRSRAA